VQAEYPDLRLSLEELEELLSFAEQLHEKLENLNRRVSLYRLFQILAAGASLALLALGLVIGRLWEPALYRSEFSIILIIVASTAAVTGAGMWLFVNRMRARSYPDRAALEEIVELIREIESVAADNEAWSALERARFRIRLSRLKIAP